MKIESNPTLMLLEPLFLSLFNFVLLLKLFILKLYLKFFVSLL